MEQDGVEKIARSWIAMHLAGRGSEEYESEFWAFEALDNLTHEKPAEALQVIRKVVELSDSGKVLGYLGAGPIEDAMLYHGLTLIDLIESEARTNPKFKKALATVSLYPEDTPVWKRFYEIADVEPPFR